MRWLRMKIEGEGVVFLCFEVVEWRNFIYICIHNAVLHLIELCHWRVLH